MKKQYNEYLDNDNTPGVFGNQEVGAIIPYNETQLRWHLTNNVMGLSPDTINKIIQDCNDVNEGLKELTSEIGPNTGVSIADMLDDLKIDYNE